MGFHGFETDPRKVKMLWGEAAFQFVDHVNIAPLYSQALTMRHREAGTSLSLWWVNPVSAFQRIIP
jgi:hypothetical protein